MFKRLLAFVLAGCLVLETPLISYAAIPQTQKVTEDVTEIVTEEGAVSEEESETAVEEMTSEEETETTAEEMTSEEETETATEEMTSEEETETTAEEMTSEEEEETTAEEMTSEEETETAVEEMTSEEETETTAEEMTSEEETETATEEIISEEKIDEEEQQVYNDAVTPEYVLEKQGDGSYKAETDDYTISFLPEAGYSHLRVAVSMEAKDGKSLDNHYNLEVYYKAEGHAENKCATTIYKADNYKSIRSVAVSNSSEYSMHFILKDMENKELASFTGDIELSTKEEPDDTLIIYDTIITENSITFDIESFTSGLRCYYVPTDGSEEEKLNVTAGGWNPMVISALTPGKEYYFQFKNAYGKVLYETNIFTKEMEIDVKCNVSASITSSSSIALLMQADVSGYKGDEKEARFYYEYTDALGVVWSSYQPINIDNIAEIEGTEKKFKWEYTSYVALLADTTYDFTVWLEIGGVATEKEIIKVQVPKTNFTGEISLLLTQSTETLTDVSYSVSLGNWNGTTSVNGTLFYRPQGYFRYASKTFAYSGSVIKNTISNLQCGATYEFVVIAGGVKKEFIYTLSGTPVELKIENVETNAYDIVRTFGLESTEDLEEEYYLNLKCSANGGQSAGIHSKCVVLNKDNNYQATLKTATVKSLQLIPNRDYYLEWEVVDSSNGSVVHKVYENFHTPDVNITLENIESKFYSHKLKATLKEDDVANFENFSTNLSVYIRKKGTVAFHGAGTLSLSKSNGYSYTKTFDNLEADTTYQVFLQNRTQNPNWQSSIVEFTTPEDTRTLKVTEVDAKVHYANLNYSLTEADLWPGYIQCYIKEKGTDDSWQRIYNSKCSGSDYSEIINISKYKNEALKTEATYEFQIGFNEETNGKVGTFEVKDTGEFTIKKDMFCISETEVKEGYTFATIQAKLSDENDSIEAHAHCHIFLKEKTESEWNTCISLPVESMEISRDFTSLKMDTEYDYAVVINNSEVLDDPGEVEEGAKKVVGEFKTKKNGYTLEFEADEKNITDNSAVVSVIAKGSEDEEQINVELALSDGQKQNITLKKEEGYKKDVIFENLVENTEYTITNAIIRVKEEAEAVGEIVISEQECSYKFKTCMLYSIKLSEERIFLNAAHAGENCEESAYKLEAEIIPETGTKELVWSSSDETVAKVSADGTVIAQGVGTAVITVKLSEDESVYATCEVVVRDYVAGHVDEEGNVQVLDANYTGLTIYINSSLEGIGLYERLADGTLIVLTDYAVSVEDNNIVSWEDGKFVAKVAGSTRVIFEKDGIRESFQINVIAEDVEEEIGEVLYALANVDKKISNVEFPESWGKGWSWKYPDTPLVTNGVDYDNKYPFEAVYSGSEGYPCEAILYVYMANITGVRVEEVSDNHNKVLEVGESDCITLSINPVYQGTLSDDLYTTGIYLPKNKKGLVITKNNDGTYNITAQKKGSYTLKAEIKSGDKVVAKTTYKIKAVDVKQADSITLSAETEGVTIDGNRIVLNMADDKQSFKLRATVKDRNGVETETALQWKISDKRVATVKTVSKKDTHNAEMTIKEGAQGHAVITVMAKDATGCKAQLNLEVQNHAPRIDKDKARVNIAYDYNSNNGKELATNEGAVEIVPVYGESIQSVEILKQENQEVEKNLGIEQVERNKYLIKPLLEEIDTGIYKCILRVKTDKGESYDYGLEVTVEDEFPKVTYKADEAVNLFYTNATGRINLVIADNNVVDNVAWTDQSEGTDNGFKLSHEYSYNGKKYTSYVVVTQQNIKVADGNLQDESVARGTLAVKVRGFRDACIIENVSIKYTYKKPVIVTKKSSGKIAPSIGQTENYFTLYNKTEKKELEYASQNAGILSSYFDKITCDSQDVSLNVYEKSSKVDYSYKGKEKKEVVNITLGAPTWREALQTKHTIHATEPQAMLKNKQLTFNTNAKSKTSTEVLLKDMPTQKCVNIEVKGANKKAQTLLDKGWFVITADGNQIFVEQRQQATVNETISKGTYNYYVTPYCKHAVTGENVALNKMTLKIKVVDKPVKATIKPKGSLDLAKGTAYSVKQKSNVVIVNPKFSNWSEGYSVIGYKLVGEYSNYFKLNYENTSYGKEDGSYYITIKNVGKLKAKQAYKLAVEYTVQTETGNTVKITSSTFTIKPKQSKPKVTIRNNNQTMYVAADDCVRYYNISVQNYYEIESASGSIDCNKDGKADIIVSGKNSLAVKIVDRDAVGATEKGKTYSIPVTVNVVGRDGIDKDAKIKISVKVKH